MELFKATLFTVAVAIVFVGFIVFGISLGTVFDG